MLDFVATLLFSFLTIILLGRWCGYIPVSDNVIGYVHSSRRVNVHNHPCTAKDPNTSLVVGNTMKFSRHERASSLAFISRLS